MIEKLKIRFYGAAILCRFLVLNKSKNVVYDLHNYNAIFITVTLNYDWYSSHFKWRDLIGAADLSGCKKNVLWILCVVGISIKFCN